jgi:hypothetical protein
MSRRSDILAVVAFVAVLGTRTAVAETAAIGAVSASGPIRVDGVLDEPAWAGAAVIADLTQQDPHPGEPTPFRTEVRILVDSKNLYLGFTCLDPEPDKISVHTLQRDASLDGDDHVAIALDTFLDNRTGYVFRINAAGARQDGLIYGPDSESSDWDGIWEGRARDGPRRWSFPPRRFASRPGRPPGDSTSSAWFLAPG